MSSTRNEHNVDACVKGAASFFMACSGNPVTTLKIPAAMRAKGYSDTEAIDRALQMQVHWEVEKLKGASATLSTVALMVTLSLMVTTRAHTLILPEDANSTWPLDLPLPLLRWEIERGKLRRWRRKKGTYRIPSKVRRCSHCP
jgi:hypothetical protein